MKKVSLTESDLTRIVKRVLTENEEKIKVKKVYREKYGNPSSGRCFENPKLNKSCDSGKSFIELEDGTIIKYPDVTFTSYVDNGTYEGNDLKKLSPPRIVQFKINGKWYMLHKLIKNMVNEQIHQVSPPYIDLFRTIERFHPELKDMRPRLGTALDHIFKDGKFNMENMRKVCNKTPEFCKVAFTTPEVMNEVFKVIG